MATQQNRSHPWRALALLGVILAIVFGVVAGGSIWGRPPAQWAPQLALDLQGGTQIILTPEQEGEVSSEAIDQAIGIIRQRVDGTGVTEAEISRQGQRDILVALPGTPDPETRDLVRQAAQLNFRAVLVAATGFSLPQPTALPTDPGADPNAPLTDPTAAPSAAPSGTAPSVPVAEPVEPTVTPGDGPTDGPTTATEGGGRTVVLDDAEPVAATLAPEASDAVAPSAGAGTGAVDPSLAPDPSAALDPSAAPEATAAEPSAAAAPTDGSDLAWITPEIQQRFDALNCLEDPARAGGTGAPDDEPLVACSADGTEKYVLGPVEVSGENVADAVGTLETNAQGFSTGQWIVQIEFDGTGTGQFADITERLFAFGEASAQNRFAVVLDDVVISAPGVNEPIAGGQAQISGGFTQESAQTLGQQLKFGALPISFEVQTEDQISATLGSEQLDRGILAGAIGIALVVIYMLVQYRALGLVTIASLGVVALLTYGVLLFLSWRQGYRLSLAGVTGLIVAVGVTADSFIIYFERIRDEVRDGRSLATAVEIGWARARRTIIASDGVSFIAAVVLFALAVGGVRGFAFTLGITTLIDLLVVFLFTKPLVTLLARTRFFATGHRLSGFDAEHLGSVVARNALRSGARRVGPRAPVPAALGGDGRGVSAANGPTGIKEVAR